MLRIVGSVVAPTTLLTGLLFYFGQMYVAGYCRYFSVNFTTLDMTVQDYLIRSVEGVFFPLVLVAGLALAAFWFRQIIFQLLHRSIQRAMCRVARPAAVAIGVALLAVAVAELLTGGELIGSVPELGGLSLAGGVLLLTYAVHLIPGRSPSRPDLAIAEWGAVFVLVSVGLFWTVGSYATGIGTGRAEQMETGLAASPDTVLYSQQSLSLHGPGVLETHCRAAHAAYAYRYQGLKLVLESGNEYFFLPAGWTSDNGAAFLIPRTDTLRLEFDASDHPLLTTAC